MRKAVAEWLRRYVKQRGQPSGARWTVTDLALASGVARATLQRWLSETGDAEAGLIEKVAKVVGSYPEGSTPNRMSEPSAPFWGSQGGESQLGDRDLFWLIVNKPDQAVATLKRWQDAGMEDDAILAFLEDAEQIVREKHGVAPSKFIANLREQVRKRAGG